jgi:hypothetical protein
MPSLVNAATSVAALAREQARMKREHEAAIAKLNTAIDALRGNSDPADARILAPARVQRARGEGARLFIGRGPAPLDTYLHVDTAAVPGVDIAAPFRALPFAAGEISEMVASHVFERLSRGELEDQVLPAWVSLLKPGGALRAVVLDGAATMDAVGRGECAFEDFRSALFGDDGHLNMFTAESLAAALRAAGLVDVQLIAQGRKSGKVYELEIAARTPEK